MTGVVANPPKGMVMDFNVGPIRAFGVPEATVIRHYDQTTSTFTILGREVELRPLLEETIRVRAAADKWIAQRQGEV